MTIFLTGFMNQSSLTMDEIERMNTQWQKAINYAIYIYCVRGIKVRIIGKRYQWGWVYFVRNN
jgi:hypothetical protein